MRYSSFSRSSLPVVRGHRPALLVLGLVGALVCTAVAQDSMSTLVPEAARKAVARRQEMVAKADEAAMRGSKLMADKDYQGAVSELKKAMDLLPDAPVVESRREEYTRQFADASVLLARQRAEEGRYTEAIQITEAVLQPSVDPENVAARQLLEDLNDPEIYPQAITPEHIARVKRVETALKEASSHIRIGDYDGAEKRYHEALNYDPYNSAARRGLEDVEKHRRLYYDTAYDQTRSSFLRQVESQWEMTVPRFALDRPGEDAGPTRSRDGVDYINEKLKNIIIPEVEFEDTPFSAAIEFLRQKSRELDDLEPDPTRKGVNIIIRAGGSGGGGGAPVAAAGGLGFDDPAGGGGGFGGDDAASQPISLKLSRVPLVEALRYTTELARLKYKVEPHAVVVIPITEQNADLFIQTFRVPPSFLNAGGGGDAGGNMAGDPFADLGGGGGGGAKIAPKKSAKEVLEGVGVTFPPDSSALYNPTNSQLVVRNTQQNLDLVEAYVDSLKEDVQKQIFITSKFVEIAQDNNDTFGFDWLLGQSNVPGTERVFSGGGTIGNARSELNSQDFGFVQPGQGSPFGGNIITSGLRSGNLAVAQNSIDSLLTNTIGGQTVLAPAIFSMAGVFTDPQFQVVLRAINQSRAADLMSAPSVVARSGEVARLEVIREFIYPTEYDPPEIPQQFGAVGGGGGGGGVIGGGPDVSSFPVTPANPTAFEQRNVGVTLETTPTIGPDGFTIDLQLNPEVVEFEGFINYGSPIFTGGVSNGRSVQILLTENRIEMPVFATRRVTTGVTIWDGQTVAIGGLMREDVQHVQDKLPFLGDLPFAGFLFRMESEVRQKKNLTIFVTARLIDPSGAPINDSVTGALQPVPGL